MSKKQEDILNTSIKLFNEYGFVNVGVDRIIHDSNVAKMTFYKYFPSKDNLIRECLLERDKLIRKSIMQALSSCDDGIAKLKGLFDWYANWFKQKDFFGCMFVKANDELIHDVLLIPIIIEHKTWLTNTITIVLKDIKTELSALQIRIILDGATVNENVYGDNAAITESWALIETMLNYAKLNLHTL